MMLQEKKKKQNKTKQNKNIGTHITLHVGSTPYNITRVLFKILKLELSIFILEINNRHSIIHYALIVNIV